MENEQFAKTRALHSEVECEREVVISVRFHIATRSTG